jgi:DNA-binding transcriptional LysR family regulator
MPDDRRIRRRLRLRDLDTIIAVAQHGSMAKAAAHLSVSQPAVSKAIDEMEHVLGVRLLDRTAQGVEPNLYGRALMKWAAVVFDGVRQGVSEIEFLADPTAGDLQLGATGPIIAGLLPAIIERLRSRHPRISITVNLMTSPEQYRELRERNVDLTLGRIAQPIDGDCEAEVLFQERTLVVAGLDNRWGSRRKIGLAELINEPWVLPPPDTVGGSLIAKAFQASGLDVPRSNVLTVSMELMGTLLATGSYLGILPASMLQFSGKRLGIKALPVALSAPPMPVAVTSLKNRTISPVAELFIACAREVARPLAKGK